MSLFNEGDPKYKCCCHRTHVRSGAIVIGILEAGSLLTSFIRFSTSSTRQRLQIRLIEDDQEYQVDDKTLEYVATAISAVMFVVSLIAVICLFWGIFKIKPKFLIPEMVLLLGSIVVCAILIIFTIVVLAAYMELLERFVQQQQANNSESETKLGTSAIRLAAQIVGGILIVTFLIAIGLNYWFYTVIKKCYVFLKDKERFLQDNAGARYVVGGVQQGNPMECQPMVVIQAPSSSWGQQEPPPGYTQKY